MHHILSAAAHSRQSILGTLVTLALGFVGRVTLSDTALVMGILSGLATFLYTCWKWHADYKTLNSKKHKK